MTRSTNYIAYRLANGFKRVGSLNLETELVQPLSYASGTVLQSLYEVIEIGHSAGIVPSGEPIGLSSVRILPPISGRDILAVGSHDRDQGLDLHESDPLEAVSAGQPTHPIIFTKRATSIIAHREPILPHAGFTDALDYEGKIGVIVGKPGLKIRREDAMSHIWGYTIINDVTDRARQRDQKHSYIGKSADTFCPTGPIAVAKEDLPTSLRIRTSVKTWKGQEKRQEETVMNLAFCVPVLIETISQSQTLQSGDVLATGNPTVNRLDRQPLSFLEPGDEVSITVTGLGTLSNRVALLSSSTPSFEKAVGKPHISFSNAAKYMDVSSERIIHLNSKPLHYLHLGPSTGPPVVFIHCLGGLSENYHPLIRMLQLKQTHSLHLMDLEGHGMSPTLASSVLTISSFAANITALLDHVGLAESNDVTIIAHSMGCLIAMQAALLRPRCISKLILLGPPPSPLPGAASRALRLEAAAVRKGGMCAVVDEFTETATSKRTQSINPLATAAMRLSFLSQDPEGYAKGCTALADSTQDTIDVSRINAEAFFITGAEDRFCPPAVCESYNKRFRTSRGVHILQGIGHWHLYEDLNGVSRCIANALGLKVMSR